MVLESHSQEHEHSEDIYVYLIGGADRPGLRFEPVRMGEGGYEDKSQTDVH